MDKSNIGLSQNQSIANLLHASLSFLPGSVMIQIEKDDYLSFLKPTIHKETKSFIKDVGKIRRNSKSIKYSNIKYNTDELKDCELAEFLRYYDAENSFSFHFDFDCKDDTLKLGSNLIKSETVNLKYFNIEKCNDQALIKTLNGTEKISFKSNGETSVIVPRQSFFILSWSYQPPDIQDIL